MADDDLFNIDFVRQFIIDQGGKVRNHELVTHFKSYLSDPRCKVSNRQKFKIFVNTLATVKLDETGEKVLVLKKKFRDDEPAAATALPAEKKLSKLEAPKAKLKDSFPVRKPSVEGDQTKGSDSESLLDSIQKELGKGKETSEPDVPKPDYEETIKEPPPDYDEKGEQVEAAGTEPEPDYESSSKDDSEVFQDVVDAPIKVTSEAKAIPEPLSENKSNVRDDSMDVEQERPATEETVEVKPVVDQPMSPVAMVKPVVDQPVPPVAMVTPVVDRPVPPVAMVDGSNKQSKETGIVKDEKVADTAKKPQLDEENKENEMNTEEPSELDATVNIKDRVKHLNKISSEGNIHSPQVHVKKSLKKHDNDDGQVVIHLGKVEREWLLASAKADYQPMAKLSSKNPHLAKMKDFTNGYTALHWAAKHGKADVVKMLCGTDGVLINARSNGGYTPLHLAAIQGHEEVIEILVKVYGADANLRDYSGKKPKQYLKNAANSHVQQMLQAHRPSQSLASNFKRSGSYSSKINTAGHFGIKANTAMRTSWADNKRSISRSPSQSPKQSPSVGRKGSNADDFLSMPPPYDVPIRRKKSKQKTPIDSISNNNNQDISRSGSDPMLSKSEAGINRGVHQSTSYTSFV